MTKLCSASSFTRTPHYSSLNVIYFEDQELFHNIAKNWLDIFGYSSVSELQSFPFLPTRLPGFCPRVYRDRKMITLREFEFRPNCKQHVMFHQGKKEWLIRSNLSKRLVQFNLRKFCWTSLPLGFILKPAQPNSPFHG